MDTPENLKREDQIAAYLYGEMTPEEATAFEEMIETDETLRLEMKEWQNAFDAARDWMEAEVPGIERLRDMEVPPLTPDRTVTAPQKVSEVTILHLGWRFVAAAAIFLVGFYLGGLGQSRMISPARRPVPGKPVETKVTQTPIPTYTTEEDGLIKVETTLAKTGSQAFWVVDASLKINGELEN